MSLVAIGGAFTPDTVLSAYRQGMFPMPVQWGRIGWFSPDTRGILELGDLHVSRSLRRSMRRFEFSVDTAFEEVIDGCASGRPVWIDRRMRAVYLRLHELGWAHSVETWLHGELAGGLYGLALGGLFAAESKFHRATDASKAALVALVQGLADDGAERLVDVQYRTDHLSTLGASECSRAQYLARLPRLLATPEPQMFAPPKAGSDRRS